MNKYLEILNLFVSNDKYRPAMTIPNKDLGYTSATDAYSLVFFNSEFLPPNTEFEHLGKYPDISHFINKVENKNEELDIAKINSILEKCPLIEDFDEEEKEDICKECYGSGEVTFTYEDNKSKDHEIDGECPICEGFGKCKQTIEKPNGKMVRNNDYYLMLNNCSLSLFLIERLLKVSQILESKIILVSQTESNKEIVFKVGDVKILLMPLMRDSDSDYCLGNIA